MICFSVFYNRNEGKIFHEQFVYPTFKYLTAEGLISSFLIWLSDIQGAHYRFLINCPPSQKHKITSILTQRLTAFFNRHPSTKIAGEKINMFMDFPNNSLYFDIFQSVHFDPFCLASAELREAHSIISGEALSESSGIFRTFSDRFQLAMVLLYTLIFQLYTAKNLKKIDLVQAMKIVAQRQTLQSEFVQSKALDILHENESSLTEYFDVEQSNLATRDIYSSWSIFCNSLSQKDEDAEFIIADMSVLISKVLFYNQLEYTFIAAIITNQLIVGQKL